MNKIRKFLNCFSCCWSAVSLIWYTGAICQDPQTKLMQLEQTTIYNYLALSLAITFVAKCCNTRVRRYYLKNVIEFSLLLLRVGRF